VPHPGVAENSLQETLGALPDAPGAYLMKDAEDQEIYVGKAKSLRKRVLSYFRPGGESEPSRKVRQMVREVAGLDYIETASEVEALILESRLIKDLQPRYNIRFRSDAGYPYVEVTWGEDFPQVVITRQRGRKGSKYYGPFIEVTELRQALRLLRRVFRFRGCSSPLRAEEKRARQKRPCLNHALALCAGACAGRISREEYRGNIRRFTEFLQGRRGEVLGELEKKMSAAAARMNFEEAAELRDQIESIKSLDRRGSLADGIEPDVPAIDPREGMAKLGRLLGMRPEPVTVEGIDIATLGGGESVGAVVTFARGLPARDGYRRFKIKTVDGQDDYAMIREVVERRCSRLRREGKPLPDIVLIDGGPGQLRAAAEAMRAAGVEPAAARVGKGGAAKEPADEPPALSPAEGTPRPVLLSLAKKRETLYGLGAGAGAPRGMSLPRRSPALRILQFVRDEAHRFAQHYHHILRRKRVLEENGPKRKKTSRRGKKS